MTEREALMRAVCDNPDDDTPRLVFADWLDENSGSEADRAHAEFIRVQIESARLPGGEKKDTLEQHAKKLLTAHRGAWTAPLAEFGDGFFGNPFEFRRGFVEAVGMDPDTFIESAGELFALAPIREVWFGELEDYDDIARCKHLRRLTALDLTGSGLSRHFGPAPLIRSPNLKNLTVFRLGGQDDNGHLDREGIEALVWTQHLGKVEVLDLSGNWLNQFDPNTFTFFLTAKNLPALRELDLARVGLRSEEVATLATTPWVAQLRVLNLYCNPIGEYGARALLGSPWLANVEMLDLRKCLDSTGPLDDPLPISPATRQALTERFGPRVLF